MILRGLGDDLLTRNPAPGVWSAAQVVEHMVLGHGPYLDTIETGLDRTVRCSAEPQIRYSFCGQLLIRIVPNSTTRAPREPHPSLSPNWRQVLSDWHEQQNRLNIMLDRAIGIDLSAVKVSNRYIPIVRMNLADYFEILSLHGEHHMGQIEQRLRSNM